MGSLDSYFKKAGKHALLTREEEQELAKAMEGGDNLAREIMVKSNLRLAISIAKRYMNRGCDFEDLLQESNIGLIKAVDKFDWRRGVKFSTYATWWIKQSVRKLVTDQSSNIKMPASSNAFYYRSRIMIQEYTEEFGFPPSNSEVAEFMGVSESTYISMMNCYKGTISIDSSFGDSEDSPKIKDTIPSNDEDPGDVLDREKIGDIIKSALLTLTPREEIIIRLRFGISESFDDHLNFPITNLEIKKLDQLVEGDL